MLYNMYGVCCRILYLHIGRSKKNKREKEMASMTSSSFVVVLLYYIV